MLDMRRIPEIREQMKKAERALGHAFVTETDEMEKLCLSEAVTFLTRLTSLVQKAVDESAPVSGKGTLIHLNSKRPKRSRSNTQSRVSVKTRAGRAASAADGTG